jgi:hypothetical protein
LWVIRDKRSHREFALLEDKLVREHLFSFLIFVFVFVLATSFGSFLRIPQKSNCSKFGVIYGRDGQDETQMYNNGNTPWPVPHDTHTAHTRHSQSISGGM